MLLDFVAEQTQIYSELLQHAAQKAQESREEDRLLREKEKTVREKFDKVVEDIDSLIDKSGLDEATKSSLSAQMAPFSALMWK